MKTIENATFSGQRVLLRLDLNLPVQDGAVTDTTRLDRILPTVRHLVAQGARVLILAHFGRPKGAPDPAFSLQAVYPALAAALPGVTVRFVDDCIGPKVQAAVADLPEGGVVLLENTRFYPGEEKNAAAFVSALAQNGDVFVNDAFSASHRQHASVYGLAQVLPAFAGLSMAAELSALESALTNPQRPVAAVVGGAKVSSKIAVLENLVGRVETLMIAGGMANTFLLALGHDVGASLVEADAVGTARAIMARAADSGCTIALPQDVVVADAFANDARRQTVPVTAVPADWMILDAGPQTVAAWGQVLADSKTCVWNGPLGAFEMANFATGTIGLAQEAARLCQAGALTAVAGGGDTVAALAVAGVIDDFTYISTAGGAFLEWLEGKTLPGVAILHTSADKAA